MKKLLKNYTITNNLEDIKEIENRQREYEVLKKKLENYFGFEIVDYIISDILDCETYSHVCLMINLAVLNDRISSENSIFLKNGLKELFKIDNNYAILNKDNSNYGEKR